MASSPISSSMSLFFLLFLQVTASKTASDQICPIGSCSPSGPEIRSPSGPEIRFPFRIREVQGKQCGYEGFEVSCDNRNRTILHLSEAGDFVVDIIDYADQYVLLKDPNDCLPKRLLEDRFMSSSWPFLPPDYKSFALANCSSVNSSMIGPEIGIARLDCLSLASHMVAVVVTDDDFTNSWMLQHHCFLSTISSPWWGQRPTNISESIWLRWFEPDCTSSEKAMERCRLKDSKWGLEVIRMQEHKHGKVGRYAIAALFMIPWLGCIFGCIWFLKVRVFVRRGLDQISSNGVPNSAPLNGVDGEAIELARRDAVGVVGIGSPTIESYLKTRIDDLGQLPRPNDDVCAICLSKYERDETIRTIPKCEHYFHAYCIDRWLRKNASCPLCRNHKGYTNAEV